MARNPEVTAIISAKDKASAVLNGFGLSLKNVGVIGATTFAVGIGVKAVQAAANFETALANVSTLLDGDAVPAINNLRQGILDLSSEVPKSADELGLAAYDIVSAGITDTSEALKVLRASSRLAVAGLGDTKQAVNLMTSAINAFREQNLKADDIANILFSTVKAGKTTVEELAVSFGNVAAGATTAGVTLQELQAATAALTTVGVRTSTAQERLRALFDELTRSTGKLSDGLKVAGVQNTKMQIQSQGLKSVLDDLLKSVNGDIVAFKNLFSSVEAGGAAVFLVDAASQAYTDTLAKMNAGTNVLDEAVQKQTETFNAQVQLLKNEFNKVMIQAGTVILPVLIEAIKLLKQGMDGLGGAAKEVSFQWNRWTDFLLQHIETIDRWIERFKTLGSTIKNVVTGLPGAGIIRGAYQTVGEFGASLLGFQSGGVVPGPLGSPQLAVVHGGERITPVSGLTRGGSGSSIVVNISGNTISNTADMQDLADRVGEQIMRRIRYAQTI